MKIVIENLIKSESTDGVHGDYHFRYIEFNVNEPWFSEMDEYNTNIGKALFSLTTLHDEYFPNKVETDWATGEIIKL